MEGIREIARSYYERATADEKKSFLEYFLKMDINGDAKVSHQEMKNSCANPWLTRDDTFRELDKDGDGALDIQDVKCLYYMEKKLNMSGCDGCGVLLFGPHFSCRLCLGKFPNTFDLCWTCYSGGGVSHVHSSDHMLDHRSVIQHFLKSSAEQESHRKMEGIREIGRSYYARATEDEKKSITEYFSKMDINSDGKVSHLEMKNCANPWLTTEDTFRKLDKDGDGALDIQDVICLYYMEKKRNIMRCDGCRVLLFGPHFSCMLCLGKPPNTFDLCCTCYSGGGVSHEHSSDHMLDHHSLIMAFIRSTCAEQKSHRKKEMEELHQIAKAHYRAGSPSVKSLAREFFESMDTDGDGRVNISEFLTFMGKDWKHLQNPNFFQEVDIDGNGTLDFFEVMTIYYIMKSGRPSCDGCENFIPGIYFSCVGCFNVETSFDLCRDCYESNKCSHNHNGRVQFLDNYTMLRTRRDSAGTTSSNASISQAPSYSNAIVPANNANGAKWMVALNAFEVGLKIGNIAATLCTIL